MTLQRWSQLALLTSALTLPAPALAGALPGGGMSGGGTLESPPDGMGDSAKANSASDQSSSTASLPLQATGAPTPLINNLASATKSPASVNTAGSGAPLTRAVTDTTARSERVVGKSANTVSGTARSTPANLSGGAARGATGEAAAVASNVTSAAQTRANNAVGKVASALNTTNVSVRVNSGSVP